MADAEQPPAKRSRFDTSNGQAAPSARAPGAAPAKKPTAEAAKAAMVKAKAALERMRALKASKVTACPAFQCSPTRNEQIAKAYIELMLTGAIRGTSRLRCFLA